METKEEKICNEIVKEMYNLFVGEMKSNTCDFENSKIAEIVHNVAVNIYLRLIFLLHDWSKVSIEDIHAASEFEERLNHYNEE